jgi:hypothetical protein
MDSNGDPTAQCDSENGISDSDMQACVADDSALIDQYLQIDSPIGGTPTTYVNGANVKTTYSAISAALCAADSSLSGCSAAAPLDAEREVKTFCTADGEIVA